MRHVGFVLMLLSVSLLASPVMPQPYSPLQPRQPVILNGCTENALFAVLNSDAGRACLRYLPRAANVATSMSVFCRGARWGCCDKAAGYPACKIEEAIPTRRIERPPAAIDPG